MSVRVDVSVPPQNIFAPFYGCLWKLVSWSFGRLVFRRVRIVVTSAYELGYYGRVTKMVVMAKGHIYWEYRKTLPQYVLFYVLFVSIVLFYVLFVCKCVLYYCQRVSTQLQLNISYQMLMFRWRTCCTQTWTAYKLGEECILSSIITGELTACSKVLLEKLVKKFSAMYENQMFITVYTTARHLISP